MEKAVSLTDLLRGDLGKLLGLPNGAMIVVIMVNSDKTKEEKKTGRKEPRYGIDPPVVF